MMTMMMTKAYDDYDYDNSYAQGHAIGSSSNVHGMKKVQIILSFVHQLISIIVQSRGQPGIYTCSMVAVSIDSYFMI